MIAESHDAAGVAVEACAWCEEPLRAVEPPARAEPAVSGGTARRCPACGSRTRAWAGSEQVARAAPISSAWAGDDARLTAERCSIADALRRRASKRLAVRVARMAPPGAILDVASGDGTLLDALRASGRVATGIGRLPERGDVHDIELTELGGRYAAIVFWQSLGGLRTPRAALEHAASLLKPDGLLTIAQPTSLGLPALSERWHGVPRPVERVRIPQRALVERLRALGLEVLHADRVQDGATGRIGRWPATFVGGVLSVEARR
ncbi:MAG TPA: class I SAM-dependent methyltransferase [Conexibacter sp.]